MYNKTTYNIKRIKEYRLIRRMVTAICVIFVTFGTLFFITYTITNKRQAIKYISHQSKANLRMEKIMTNPRMIFEYDDGELYNIKAKQAMHKDESDILLSDVSLEGAMGTITAGRLLISNNGDTLYFSENPVLLIKQTDTK